MKNQHGVQAFTLIELLVAILIVAILIGITIPAVQMARESSRRVTCLNNLRQLGIAINAYDSDFDCMPLGNHSGGYSLHTLILPYLEQKALYSSINFSIPPSHPNFSLAENASIANTQLSVFLCPSDGWSRSNSPATNYAGNMGYGYCENLPYKACNNGVVTILPIAPIRSRDITDGLSNTVAMAEWLFNPSPPNRRDEKRSVLWLEDAQDSVDAYESFVSKCAGMDINLPRHIEPEGRGSNWFTGTVPFTLYTHALSVNQHSCINGISQLRGVLTATSQHGGGANSLYADGHVDFTRETVDRRVWRALGTRASSDF